MGLEWRSEWTQRLFSRMLLQIHTQYLTFAKKKWAQDNMFNLGSKQSLSEEKKNNFCLASAVFEAPGSFIRQARKLKSIDRLVAVNTNTPTSEVAHRFWPNMSVDMPKANQRAFVTRVPRQQVLTSLPGRHGKQLHADEYTPCMFKVHLEVCTTCCWAMWSNKGLLVL